MAVEKVSPGERLGSTPPLKNAGFVNDLVNVVKDHKQGDLTRPGRPPQAEKLGSDFVKVRNDSGADRDRGDVLQLGTYLLTAASEAELYNLWLAADTPAAPLWKCVILQHALLADAIGPAHASGVCVAKVNVGNVLHTHASPTAGSHVLASGYSGGLELLSPPDGTGEQLMAVRFHPLPQMLRATFNTNGTSPAAYASGNFTHTHTFTSGFETGFSSHSASNRILIPSDGDYLIHFHTAFRLNGYFGSDTHNIVTQAYLNGSTLTGVDSYPTSSECEILPDSGDATIIKIFNISMTLLHPFEAADEVQFKTNIQSDDALALGHANGDWACLDRTAVAIRML